MNYSLKITAFIPPTQIHHFQVRRHYAVIDDRHTRHSVKLRHELVCVIDYQHTKQTWIVLCLFTNHEMLDHKGTAVPYFWIDESICGHTKLNTSDLVDRKWPCENMMNLC